MPFRDLRTNFSNTFIICPKKYNWDHVTTLCQHEISLFSSGCLLCFEIQKLVFCFAFSRRLRNGFASTRSKSNEELFLSCKFVLFVNLCKFYFVNLVCLSKTRTSTSFHATSQVSKNTLGLCSFSLDFIYMYAITFIYISWQKVVWKSMWQSRMCAVLFCVLSGSTRGFYIILNISNSKFY